MDRVGFFALRGVMIVAGSAAMLAGLFAAVSGEGDGQPQAAQPYAPLATPTREPTGAPTPGLAAPPSTTEPIAQIPTQEGAPVSDSSPAARAQPTASPATSPPPGATPAGPVTDLPAYSDVQVLALAADARLPSGLTFAQCVALGPNGAHWPVPVHLYYEGHGKWTVETHDGEVGVEFDEATATFRVKHFAPAASECLKPG